MRRWKVLALSTSFLLPLVIFFHVEEILPGIMQDEYIYSMQARYLDPASFEYPVYLHSFIYQYTSICGPGFYACAKFLNSVFLGLSIGSLFVIAGSLLSGKAKYFLPLIAAIGPIGVYTSFFMPESMFFALNLLAVALLVSFSEKTRYPSLLGVSVLLGAALLVKRHELFILPAFAVAIFVLLASSQLKWIAKLALAIVFGFALPVLVRLLVGLAVAGPSSINLLGSTYQNRLETFDSKSRVALVDTSFGNVQEFAVQTFVASYLGQIAVLLAAGGLLLLLIVRNPFSSPQGKDLVASKRNAAISFLATVLLIMPVVVSVYSTFLTVSGANHDGRLLFRYYEFVFPLLLIISGVLTRVDFSLNSARKIAFALISLFPLGFFVIQALNQIVSGKFADSATALGLFSYSWIVVILVGVMIVVFVSGVNQLVVANRLLSSLAVLTLVSGIGAWSSLNSSIGRQEAFFDEAGRQVGIELMTDSAAEVLVVGNNRQQVFTAMFWIDMPSSRSLLLSPDEEIPMKKIGNATHILLLTPVDFPDGATVELKSDRYTLLKLQK